MKPQMPYKKTIIFVEIAIKQFSTKEGKISFYPVAWKWIYVQERQSNAGVKYVLRRGRLDGL